MNLAYLLKNEAPVGASVYSLADTAWLSNSTCIVSEPVECVGLGKFTKAIVEYSRFGYTEDVTRGREFSLLAGSPNYV